jgi:FG-GAP-like repeat/Bacterial Ig-like domain
LNVPRSAPISVTLSQPVGGGTLHVFSAQRGGRLTGTTAVSGNTLTFTPSSPFGAGEFLQVTVPASVQSSAGASLAPPQVYQLLTATAPSSGTLAGASTLTPPAQSYANASIPADVDGDGDLDLLVTASVNPGLVLQYRNDGNGRFTPGTTISVGNYPSGGVAGDVDNDGDLDLLTYNGQEVSLRRNNGSGTFSGTTTLAAGLRPEDIQLADLDADGDLDLLSVNSAPGTSKQANVLLNDGAGFFTLVSPGLALDAGIRHFTLGDMDGDGGVDLVTDANYGFVNVYRNTGNGTFAATPASFFVGYTLYDLHTVDVDADGDLDLLTVRPNNITIGYNNGTGSLTRTSDVAITTGTAGTRLTSTDLDGDGDLDLLVTDVATGDVTVRLNNGSGTFVAAPTVALGGTPRHVTAADLNNDGAVDLLATGSNLIKIRLNQVASGGLAVSSLTPRRNAVAASRSTSVTVGFSQPLDNTSQNTQTLTVFSSQRGKLAGTATISGSTLVFDPATDLRPGEAVAVSLNAAVRSGNNQLPVAKAYQFTAGVTGGGGGFAGGSAITLGFFAPYIFTVGDADNDGDLDLFYFADSYGSGAASIQLRRNDGTGTFGAATSIPTVGDPSGLTLADVDADGDLDLLVSGGAYGYTNAPGSVRVHLNNGAGTFTTSQTITFGTYATTQALTTGDIDGDGDLDLVTVGGTTSVHVTPNLGNGTFGATTTIGVSSIITKAVHLLDIDGDDDLDILTSHSSTVRLSLNDGQGSFGFFNPLTTAGSANTLADVDADGDLDMLSLDNSTVTVRLNNGQGAFTVGSTVAVSGSGNPVDITTGDVDGDGDLDLVAGTGSTTASVRLNNGNGTFGGGSDPNTTSAPGKVTLADLDNDGDLDLVAAVYSFTGTRGFAIRLNLAPPLLLGFTPGSGTPGTVVTLTGSNLGGATGLTLNGAALSGFTVVNATTITFTVPAGASSGPITVTTPAGTAISPGSFTVLNPVPTFTSLTPSSAPAGSVAFTLTVNGSGFVAQSQVLFDGIALPTTFVAASQLTAQVPATALTTVGTYSVLVSSPAPGGGTASQSFAVTSPLSTAVAAAGAISVYPNPTHEQFTVRLSGAAPGGPVTAVLLNTLGQVVARPVLRPAGNHLEAQVPTAHLAPGLYTLRLRTAHGSFTRPVSVE